MKTPHPAVEAVADCERIWQGITETTCEPTGAGSDEVVVGAAAGARERDLNLGAVLSDEDVHVASTVEQERGEVDRRVDGASVDLVVFEQLRMLREQRESRHVERVLEDGEERELGRARQVERDGPGSVVTLSTAARRHGASPFLRCCCARPLRRGLEDVEVELLVEAGQVAVDGGGE